MTDAHGPCEGAIHGGPGDRHCIACTDKRCRYNQPMPGDTETLHDQPMPGDTETLHDQMITVCTWARENGQPEAYNWIMDRYAQWQNEQAATS